MKPFNPMYPYYVFVRHGQVHRHSFEGNTNSIDQAREYLDTLHKQAEAYVIDIRDGSVVYTQEASE